MGFFHHFLKNIQEACVEMVKQASVLFEKDLSHGPYLTGKKGTLLTSISFTLKTSPS